VTDNSPVPLSQHTFAAIGPNAEWEYIGKISASIPCQRKVKDHVERSINHYLRGKSHTSPSKESDIDVLHQNYHQSKVHDYKPGRRLDNNLKDVPADYIRNGSDATRMKKSIDAWMLNRVDKWSGEEDWTY
jgi:hypothetical protein